MLVRRLLEARVVLALIAGAGLAWFAFDALAGHEPDAGGGLYDRIAPLLWEGGFATLLLLVFPLLIGGFDWRTTFTFLPDLTLVVAVISALWLATGAARVVRLAGAIASRQASAAAGSGYRTA